MTYEAPDRILDRLIEAIAAQLGTSEHSALAPVAVEALTGLSRPEANLIFSHDGHLVHYGTNTAPLEILYSVDLGYST
ncbi:hypothetical protein [Micromonospora echinaurantiaca]|uniref:hypothetical protein n=1 Tax=Micromonospora echinaurantiaca TaxID=47857 RepID=UPI000B5B078E|nr:hypothetical protein [Micromonospora echinaurantiaca]